MDLHVINILFLSLFIVDDINGHLNFLYGLELLIPSSGTGTRNCGIWGNWNHEKKQKKKK